MFFYPKNWRLPMISILSTLLMLLWSVTPAQAATVSLLSTSRLSGGTALINLAAPTGTLCDIAVGSNTGLPNYKWFNQVPCTTVTVSTIPTSVSKIYIRVFAGGPAQDFTLNATVSTTTSVVVTPKTPTIISPTSGQIVTGPSATISWTNQSANSYTVIVGSSAGMSNYGTYTTLGTSITALNLPQKNQKVYFKVTARWSTKTLSVSSNFISAPVAAPSTTTIVPITTVTVPAPTPSPTPTGSSHISAIWAEEGGDKVAQEELRASNGNSVTNNVWNGSAVSIFGAKNEVVNFDLVLEAAQTSAGPVSVSFDTLTGPNGFAIKGKPATGAGLYNWTGRSIELFYVRYLEIKGLSAFTAGPYDETQWPGRWQAVNRLWSARPDHNKRYPDIAVPYELHDNFTIAAGKNQSIWSDIYIPTNAPAGTYAGNITIKESGVVTKTIPVQLTVRNFALPDAPSAKTMLFMGYADVNNRYLGNKYPSSATDLAMVKKIRDEHFELAHRHKISLIDADDGGTSWTADSPRPEWAARLNGQLFTAANGYDGPGVGVGNGVYAIGPYGSWSWKGQDKTAMWTHTNNWVNWFDANSPATQYFLYLMDESSDYATMNQWSNWINTNPGSGNRLPSFATVGLPSAYANVRELDIPASTMTVGNTASWQTAANYYLATAGKKYMMYNGGRPGSGSFMTEDDGTALRELAWGQYKKNVDRWFYWESTYYNNYQAGAGETDVFAQARTFGSLTGTDINRGEVGANYANGDGVLFYPGTDKVYPNESYNVPGPFASLRLKFWRRGIEDVDYLTLAAKIDAVRTQQIVNLIVPKVLWENGVDNPADPTYHTGPVSWSSDPNVWENARLQLANIIEGK